MKEPIKEESKSTERDISTYDSVLKSVFKQYYKKWKEETRFISSSNVMFENKNYQEIINMGWPAVPYIIEELRENPTHLFMALRCITGATPVKPDNVGRLHKMANDWIEWYDNLGEKR